MLGKGAKTVLRFVMMSAMLSAMMSGLCASAQPITTVTDPAVPAAGVDSAPPAHVALLLPLQSSLFGAAAEAVRTGFLTAFARKHSNLNVTVIESGDAVPDMVAAYRDAAAHYDIIVGPLSRSAVAALVQSASVTKPTIALAQPDLPDSSQQRLPPLMLMMGLSIEDEARQVAAWVEGEKKPGKIFALSTNIAWQRRAAKAFAGEARHIGLVVDELEVSMSNNVLSASGLAQLSQRIRAEKPALVFVALDASQTTQLRSAVGAEVPLYGTSQLNSLTLSAASKLAAMPAVVEGSTGDGTNTNTSANTSTSVLPRRPELDGVRLLDLPWQLQGTHPGVQAYPRSVTDYANADMERLYALGIDAFQVADELAMQHTSFDLDGVTGQLSVNMTPTVTYFQRRATQAVYQGGIVIPLIDQR